MKTVYRVLAYLIALGVVVQAMAIVLGMFGLSNWVEDGGVLDKAALDSDQSLFDEEVGFAIHAIDGMLIIPLISLALLIVSFFAHVPGGVKWAGLVLLLVVVQVLLGFIGHAVPVIGALHGLGAFLLLGAALNAARLSRTAPTPAPDQVPTGA